MQGVMHEVGGLEAPVTRDSLETSFKRNLTSVTDHQPKRKHLYRALYKLTEAEAHQVVTTVAKENGFEAW